MGFVPQSLFREHSSSRRMAEKIGKVGRVQNGAGRSQGRGSELMGLRSELRETVCSKQGPVPRDLPSMRPKQCFLEAGLRTLLLGEVRAWVRIMSYTLG